MWHQKPPLGSLLNTAHPLARSLVGAWLFNEGSGDIAINSANSASNGQLGSTVTWCPGGIKFSDTYDDANSRIGCGDALNPSAQNWEGVSFVSKYYHYPGGYPVLIANVNNSTEVGNFYAVPHAVSGFLWKGPSQYILMPLSKKNVYTVAGTWNAADGKIALYVDGKQAVSDTKTGSWTTNYDTIIGGMTKYGTWRTLQDELYYILLYSRALTAAEIASLYVDPYQMFEAVPIWMMYQTAAGGLSIPRPLSRPLSGPLGGI